MFRFLKRCLSRSRSSPKSKRSRTRARIGYEPCGYYPVYGDKTCPKQVGPGFTCYFHPNWRERAEEDAKESSADNAAAAVVATDQKPRLSEVLRNAREMKAGRPEPSLGELFATIRDNSRKPIQ
jgi:hypothetical protein